MPTSGVERLEKLVLDTSAYSHFRFGHTHVLDYLARSDAVFVPVIVIGELEAAFEQGKRARANRVALEDFLQEPFVTILPVTRTVARHYGRVFAALRVAGTPLPVNDVWIGATTLDCGGTLLTFDTDFTRIEGLHPIVLRHDPPHHPRRT